MPLSDHGYEVIRVEADSQCDARKVHPANSVVECQVNNHARMTVPYMQVAENDSCAECSSSKQNVRFFSGLETLLTGHKRLRPVK